MGFNLAVWDDETIGTDAPLVLDAAWDGLETGAAAAAAPAQQPAAAAPPALAPGTRTTSPTGQKRQRVPGGSPHPREHKRAGKAPPPSADESPPPLMEKPLPSEIAYRMLTDDAYHPGGRPANFDGRAQRWIFKERNGDRSGGNGRSKMDKKADRWHNSGGVRGARDMPAEMPTVRRRYGSVSRQGTILWRFHEYSLLNRVPDGMSGMRLEEDRSTVVFHVMPKRAGRGRPSKAEADLPAQLWQQYGFGKMQSSS